MALRAPNCVARRCEFLARSSVLCFSHTSRDSTWNKTRESDRDIGGGRPASEPHPLKNPRARRISVIHRLAEVLVRGEDVAECFLNNATRVD